MYKHMKKTILTIMSLSLLATACGPKKTELTSGIKLDNLDVAANPHEDFYRYACGGWIDNHPLDAEHARFGTFDQLAEDNRDQMKTLIDSIVATDNKEGSIADKIATLYKVGMDSVKLQEQGSQPISALLQQVASIQSRDQLQEVLISLHQQGINPFFHIFSEADYDNASMQMAWLYQGGLGMGDRDYYMLSDENTLSIRKAYTELVQKELAMAGYDELSKLPADALTSMIMQVETRLAKAQIDKVINREPANHFHKYAMADAAMAMKGFDIRDYFVAMGLPNVDTFNLAQPTYFTEVAKVVASENMESVKAYMAWCVINDAAAYLSDDFVNANFEFYGRTLSGIQQLRPRWKRVTGTLNGAMGEALGQMYVAKYFPPEAKQRMVTLVDNLRTAFAERIKDASWMEQQTKDKALEKLSSIIVKIGYPDKWRDYSGLEIKGDSYYADVLRSNRFELDYILSKVDKPTDNQEWGMTPQTVNAYYNPTTNEICFPAGILQPPFFDMTADDAANYGAIGVVIGHEMTHGFDDQGRQYDKDGNLKDWWQPADAENFKNNAEVLIKHFDGIKVLDDPETYANGTYTQGENIADNGGLHISFLAMQKAIEQGQVNNAEMDGFTPAQRFFLAYANVWAGNISNEEIINLTKRDVHALGKWRVNGTLPHITEFIETWGIQPGEAMWLDPEKRVTLW